MPKLNALRKLVPKPACDQATAREQAGVAIFLWTLLYLVVVVLPLLIFAK